MSELRPVGVDDIDCHALLDPGDGASVDKRPTVGLALGARVRDRERPVWTLGNSGEGDVDRLRVADRLLAVLDCASVDEDLSRVWLVLACLVLLAVLLVALGV